MAARRRAVRGEHLRAVLGRWRGMSEHLQRSEAQPQNRWGGSLIHRGAAEYVHKLNPVRHPAVRLSPDRPKWSNQRQQGHSQLRILYDIYCCMLFLRVCR